jgi:hypothetical protein
VAWVAQEPINAHSHLQSVIIGNTLTVPVSGGKLCLGTWQVRQALGNGCRIAGRMGRANGEYHM